MKQPLIIITAIMGVLIGLGFVFPAVALMRTSGALPNSEVALLLLGIALTLGGATGAFMAFKNRHIA
jgi:hypothetical protein